MGIDIWSRWGDVSEAEIAPDDEGVFGAIIYSQDANRATELIDLMHFLVYVCVEVNSWGNLSTLRL